jgi:hypothetical protein
VLKHYALHRNAIDADIAAIKSDWALHRWFHAGKDVADLATIAVGPIKPVYPVPTASNDLKLIPEFIAGMMFGFTGANQLAEVEACFQGGQKLMVDAEALVHLVESGEMIKATLKAKEVYSEFSTVLGGCKNMDEDMTRIKLWADIFTQPKELMETVAKNAVLHNVGIRKDIKDEKVKMSAGD